MYSTKATPRKSSPAPKSPQIFQIFIKMNKISTTTTINTNIIKIITTNINILIDSINIARPRYRSPSQISAVHDNCYVTVENPKRQFLPCCKIH